MVDPVASILSSNAPHFQGGAGGNAGSVYGAPITAGSNDTVNFGGTGNAFWYTIAAVILGMLWYRKKS